MKNEVRKVKGQSFAKVVWILGAVFVAAMTIGTILDFKNGINANWACACMKMLLYLAAFIIGLVYLFKAGKEKLAIFCACIYALAAIFGFVADVCDGSKYATLDLLSMVVNTIAFILFAFSVGVLLKGPESRMFSLCAKFWWIPSAVSMVIACINSVQTELNDSHGFDASLIVMDVVVALILLLPMFMMTLVVKNKARLK